MPKGSPSKRLPASRSSATRSSATRKAPVIPANFDPDAAATGDGLFGLTTTVVEANLVVIPVPFDAT
ncbi:MAG: hypothetical protein QM516_13875, partial [Limnohabitans sp.]|nr:hypothetical protein [Limnohabitans sp.]